MLSLALYAVPLWSPCELVGSAPVDQLITAFLLLCCLVIPFAGLMCLPPKRQRLQAQARDLNHCQLPQTALRQQQQQQMGQQRQRQRQSHNLNSATTKLSAKAAAAVARRVRRKPTAAVSTTLPAAAVVIRVLLLCSTRCALVAGCVRLQTFKSRAGCARCSRLGCRTPVQL